ncbi:restriction endonuclease subunit S [Streptomyces armeniacus]|uniref:Restriction endonuclease subunit S n=1 Tax=Streptomyces armeniacus TaxID=83291 RepID=A0A345XMU3_9ACTN|nr:restriction endonuclease subunit S [Streptomyces armeniacus]AXK32959.1 restriction endonuclease subunit S [Streptomyces armeniacus]
MSGDDGVRWVPVGELGEVRMGKQLSPSSLNSGRPHPYLRVANVLHGRIDFSDVKTMGFTSSELATYSLKPGDILLNEGQSLELVGRSAVYDGPEGEYCFQNTLVRFRVGPDVLPGYAQQIFTHWLANSVFAGIAKKTTSIAHLGADRFARLKFPLRPIAEQRRIVEALGSVADTERAVESTIAKLRSMREATLLSAIPLDGHSTKPGWTNVPLKEVVPSVQYGISEALDRDERGLPTLRMNNLRNGKPDVTELRYCPTPVREDLLLKGGDVLFNRTNSIDHVGKAGIWRGELPRATFASYLVRLHPDTKRLSPEYLVEWLRHPLTVQRVRAIATVAVQQVNVNPSRLRELTIALPIAPDRQHQIVSTLASMDDRINRELEALAKTRKLKRALADDLLSGKIRV